MSNQVMFKPGDWVVATVRRYPLDIHGIVGIVVDEFNEGYYHIDIGEDIFPIVRSEDMQFVNDPIRWDEEAI